MARAIPVLSPYDLLNAYRDGDDTDGDNKCHSLFTFVTQVLVEFSEELHFSPVTKRQRAWVPISAYLADQAHLLGCETLLSCIIYLSSASSSCTMSFRMIVKAVAESK